MNKVKLLFATNNKHKVQEIKDVLYGKYEIISLKEMGFSGDIPETGNTLQENASQKSHFVYEKYGIDCFADDTGLEVDALNGAPGVYSARYAGENCSYNDNVVKLLKEMDGMTNRNARFKTVISLILNGKEYLSWLDGFPMFQDSPFNDGIDAPGFNIVLKNLKTNEEFLYAPLCPFLIHRYGFYEGDVPFRVDPKKAIEFFQ